MFPLSWAWVFHLTGLSCYLLGTYQNSVLVLNFGIDFTRGGILFWADTLGSKYIYSKLEKWSELYGEFFKPCAYLAARAAKGIPLVSDLSSFFSISSMQKTVCHVVTCFSNSTNCLR